MSALALIGGHGVGKSSVAKALAEKENWLFVPSPGSACFRELNLPYTGLSFADRLRVQTLILQRYDEALRQAGRDGRTIICDRGPIDFASYVLAEWGQCCTNDEGEQILDYKARCLKVLNAHFAMVVLIQPGIPYVDDGSRPLPNRAFQEMHNMLCWAMMSEPEVQPRKVALLRSTLDLSVRIEGVRQFWFSYLRQASCSIATETLH